MRGDILNKPIYLLPFIFVYKMVRFIFMLIINFIKYVNIGFFFTVFVFLDFVLSIISNVIKYLVYGFMYMCYLLYKLIKIIGYGIGYTAKTIYKFIKLCGNVFIRVCHMLYKAIMFTFKWIMNMLYKISKFIYIGFVYICQLIYKGIKKIIDGFIYICYLLYKFFNFIWWGYIYVCYVFYVLIAFVGYLIYTFFKLVVLGFIYSSYLDYRFIRYVGIGFIAPFVVVYRWIVNLLKVSQRIAAKRQLEHEKRMAAKERNRQIQEENKKRLAELKQREKEEILNKKQEEKSKETDIYINKDIKIEKKNFNDYVNSFFLAIGSIPGKIKNLFTNNRLARDAQNKKDINRQALLLDFEGDDAKKSDNKIVYKYVAKDPEGKPITGYFPAYSRAEVLSFLLSEGNEVYSIKTNKWIQSFHSNEAKNRSKVKTKDLIFFCTQLSTYIKAGIPLVESLKILSKQFKNKTYTRIIRSMIYELTMGDSFSTAMEKQGEAFPRLLINMLKASEMTGELPEVLDDMSEYFTESDKTRKQMITAMTYPSIIFIFSIAAVVFIMVYVVPQFVGIYNDIEGAEIPAITIFVMNTSHFLQNHWAKILIVTALVVLVFVYLYKNIKSFKTIVQMLVMHLPVFGNVIIYNEVTMFTKTFSSLLSHNVFITDSMEILNKITNNEVYKMLILDTITNLAKGEKISLAFKNHWAFPLPAYEMITTGERTGQLPEMMSKVSNYYQELHRNSVTRIKTFVEPALIIFLTVVVGGVVLSIVIPMFSVYGTIQV